MSEKITTPTCGSLLVMILLFLLICSFVIIYSSVKEIIKENLQKNDKGSGGVGSLIMSDYEDEDSFKDNYDLNDLPNENVADFDDFGFQIIFRHVQVVVFVGSGFMMTFMEEHGRTSLGFLFAISSFVVIWYLLLDALIYTSGKTLIFSLFGAMRANLAAASFLVSFGAVFRKLNILQLYVMAIFETPLYAANKYLTDTVFWANDPGGFIIMHAFGAFFGLGIALIHGLKNGPKEYQKTELEGNLCRSSTSTKLGTSFFWVFWPFFNAVQFPIAEDKLKAALNTYLALVLSCSTAAAFIIILSREKNWKLNMVYIQNATLAGGVAIGSVTVLDLGPGEATIIGVVAGVFSFFSYFFIQDFLARKLRVHDTHGVFSLHRLPGIIGGFSGALVVYITSSNFYELELSTFDSESAGYSDYRTRSFQAVYQIGATACAMSIGFAGGLLTGALIVLVIPK